MRVERAGVERARVERARGVHRWSATGRAAAALLAVATLVAGCATSDGAGDGDSTTLDRVAHSASERAADSSERGVPTAGSSGSAAATPKSGEGSTAAPKHSEGASIAAPQRAGLRAGSVDDNQKFDDYLAYRTRVRDLGVVSRDVDPTGRTILEVMGSDGLPAVGRRVVITRGEREVASLTTTADGTVRFMPRAYAGDAGSDAVATVDGTRVVLQQGATQRLELAAAAAPSGRPKLDVVFLLDTTGSMSDEIDRLKSTIDSIARRVADLEPSPDVRFGMTIYRDLDDAYVTRTFDLTADTTAFHDALAKVSAGGGGDVPEALDEALAASLGEPSWRSDALKLVFLVADAGPHVERQVQSPYPDSMRTAAARGIKIFPVASSNSDDRAEVVFRQIAQFTGARFVFLSYGAGGAALGAGSDIDSTDYEELALDDLVVRLIAEELAARIGTKVALPQPPATTTTNPPGQ